MCRVQGLSPLLVVRNMTHRGDSPVLVRYSDDRRLHLAPVDVAGELGVPLGFDWLVQDVGVGVPMQRVDGGVNWTDDRKRHMGNGK